MVLGVVLPALLQEPSWGLTPNTGALISTVGLLGVMVGAMAVGAISDVTPTPHNGVRPPKRRRV